MTPTLAEAISTFRRDLVRRQCTARTQERYVRELHRFAAHVGADTPVVDLDPAVCRSFIDSFDDHKPATVYLECTILSSFFTHLVLDDVVDRNPMDKVRRPQVPPAQDRERVRVTGAQVHEMLSACETWPERVCLNLAAHTGARKHALSEARWRDVNAKRHTITFLEKGNKLITKPIAAELRRVLTMYWISQGPFEAEEWVIPNRRPVKADERSDKIVYHLVKVVAERCGFNAHVHSLRAAFAVHFLRSNPGQIESLRQLMGHRSISTTQGYLDELEGEEAMRVVEALSFQPTTDIADRRAA